MGKGDFPVEPKRGELSTNQESPSTSSGRTDPHSLEAFSSAEASEDRSADNGEGGQEGLSTGSERTEEDIRPPDPSLDDERICSGKHRPLQVTRTGERKLFDKKARKAFLEWFAATGNVVWSAQKVGFSDKTVWKHRMNDPRFAEAFDRAFEQSLMRNKARMVERKARPVAVEGGVGEAELEDCDLEKAWPLIVEIERAKGRNCGGAAIGRPRKAGRPPRAASNAQVRKALEKRLRAFGRRLRAEGKAPPPWLAPVEPRKSAEAPRPGPDTPPSTTRERVVDGRSPSKSGDGEDEE